MADLSITTGNVELLPSGNRSIRPVQFGETVAIGEVVYSHTDGKFYRTDNNDTAAKSIAAGITLLGGATNGWGIIVTEGSMDLGATLTVGEIYVVSSNLGKICPESDISSGKYVTVLGVATATDAFLVTIIPSGVAAA